MPGFLLATALALTALAVPLGTMSRAAFAQISDNVVRIGILGDMSGPNAGMQGPGDVVAARMAVADFGGKAGGAPIGIVSGDLLGKTGAGIARQWFDQGVDTIFSPGNSSVAIDAAGTDEAGAVMAKMRAMPIQDFMTRNGRIREDRRVIRDLYLLQVKTMAESHGEWDLAMVVATIPGEQAFRPLSDSECPLVHR